MPPEYRTGSQVRDSTESRHPRGVFWRIREALFHNSQHCGFIILCLIMGMITLVKPLSAVRKLPVRVQAWISNTSPAVKIAGAAVIFLIMAVLHSILVKNQLSSSSNDQKPLPVAIMESRMNSRKRIEEACNHKSTDKLPVDFGGGFQTGIHVSIVYQIRQKLGLDQSWNIRSGLWMSTRCWEKSNLISRKSWE